MSFPWAHVPLWPLLFFNYFPCLPLLDSLLSFVLQVCFLSSFSELCCRPRLLVFLSSILYSSLQLAPGSFNIWFHQSLNQSFQNLHPYVSRCLFQAHLPTNCFSCHCSSTPTAIFFITKKYYHGSMHIATLSFRTRSIMLLLQICEWSWHRLHKQKDILPAEQICTPMWVISLSSSNTAAWSPEITSVRQSIPNKFCSELCMDWLTV